MSSSDSDSDQSNKCVKIINPLPMKHNKRSGPIKGLVENKNIIKTRAKSQRRINNKKKAEEITVDQNKHIIQERRKKLQQLAQSKCSTSHDSSTPNDNSYDKHSTTENLKRKTRVSRVQLQHSNSFNCTPSTSNQNLVTEVEKIDTISNEKKVKFNSKEKTSKIDNQNLHHSSSNSNNISSLPNRTVSLHNVAYFDVLSKICKWNAVWLRVSFSFIENLHF